MAGKINTWLTGEASPITVHLKQCFKTPHPALALNFNDKAIWTALILLSGCIDLVRLLVAPSHTRMDVVICQFVIRRCTCTQPPSTTLQARLHEVVIRLPLVGRYHDSKMRWWIFSSTSPCGLQYVEDGSLKTLSYVGQLSYWPVTKAVRYVKESAGHTGILRGLLSRHIGSSCKTRLREGKTDRRWYAFAESAENHLMLSQCICLALMF